MNEETLFQEASFRSPEPRAGAANPLARDNPHDLADTALEDRPPSYGNRLDKLVRSDRPRVSVAILVVPALLGGIVGTPFGLIPAENRRLRAERAWVDEAERREKLEKALDRTRRTLDALTSSITEDSLTTPREVSGEQKTFLTEVLTYYREYAGEKADDERSRARTASAAYRVSSIEHRLGRTSEAAIAARLAIDGYAKLAADFPAQPFYRKELAGNHSNLGLLLTRLGKRPEAERQYHIALAIKEKLAADLPAVPEYRRSLALSHNNLGRLLAGLERRPEAEEQYRMALAIRQELAQEFPAVPGYRVDLGGTYGNLGRLVRDGGKPGESLEWFEKAIRTLTAVYEPDRRLVQARRFLRDSHSSRARAYDRLRRFTEAVKDWDKAIELTPEEAQPGLRAARASSRVKVGQVAAAVAEVAELTKDATWPAEQWSNFACVYAIASGKNADRKQEYADRAIDTLRKAVNAGFKDVARMAKDTELDPLRGREDFTKLIEELAKKSPAKPEPKP